ncbi:DUF2255 family protein [Lactiplantibacillus pentosus]|uniref:DUF2255 family protein n=1 Tax=Lactiplantibacillus pentosus TaxID=1589 RepID=UPI001ADD85A5|nr:DUF2255 family protein [Lactiplantibacillus pentosus]MBO9165338.1 DUF2255 family protein [Lactiplantibacillus pentosus]MCT3310473.1 DUF2255 family protein [Lactiplantibacillus pentosus]
MTAQYDQMGATSKTEQWSASQLTAFGQADDFQVSPFYSDGRTYGTPTWIWSVVVNQHLYIRAWNGPRSRWYRSALTQKAGRIHLAEANHLVYFKPVTDEALNDQIDQAYCKKYAGSPYLMPMVASGPRQATMQVTPRVATERKSAK